MMEKLKAKWIWLKQKNLKPYNQTVIAVRDFKLMPFVSAAIKITADSFYRLSINNQWVNDGPARGWAEHFQVDVIDVTSYLKVGVNRISVIARFDGVGSFRKKPEQAGLLAQLDVTQKNGRRIRIISDRTWDIAEAKNWLSNTPKISAQREPAEVYDATFEDRLKFKKAAELCAADEGVHQGLRLRETALLTQKPFSFKSFKEANRVERSSDMNFCVCLPRLVTPGLIDANMHNYYPFGMATIVKTTKKCTLRIQSDSWRIDHFVVSIDGRYKKNGVFSLEPGSHLLLAFNRCMMVHDKDVALRMINPPKITLENPLDKSFENPWCYLSFEEFAFSGDDIIWKRWLDANPREKEKRERYLKQTDALLGKVKDKKSFDLLLGRRASLRGSKEMFVEDDEWRFRTRRVLAASQDNVVNPSGLIYDNAEMTVVKPDPHGDIELVYDLGEQNCGYWSFEAIAEAGVVIDVYAVEYIKKDGQIQHFTESRNGFRYITKEGVNRFTSLHRRSGRYIFITIRNSKKPITFRKFELIESTYPVNYTGSFQCSDERLNKIWDISARTMKLCMEDVYVDCPAYEQTLWIGDARNEGLFGYYAFGAVDIAQNSIRLGAESMEHMPLVGCQVPSCWFSVIPVWSFLWGISVWENYWYSGDMAFLRQMWKPIIKNIRAAQDYLDENDLFSADMWNLFDWASIDQDQDTVLHNTMFMIGAIDAALKCAAVLGDKKTAVWLRQLNVRLKKAVNKTWNPKRRSYPDSFLSDGKPSPSICQHTSFLSILYDIVPSKYYRDAVDNMLKPRKEMVKVGSPFAILYLYEAMEKAGYSEAIIKTIYDNYMPMIDEGATTTWEVFAGSPMSPQGGKFPTRSHSHGWSAAPMYFLNRIVLGIKQNKAAGMGFEISPLLSGLTSASGSVATIHGPIKVSWEIKGDVLQISYAAPKNVKISFRRNDSHKGFNVKVNAERV